MGTTVRAADNRGRVILPGFANTTVIIEAISDTEYRVRKVEFPEDDRAIVLSEREARQVLEMIENPPKPNAALRRAFKRFKKNYGGIT